MKLTEEKIAHAFGLPPWLLDFDSDWPRRRRIVWRIRHPRRWWRVLTENRKANSIDD